jgi:hypothetical protein
MMRSRNVRHGPGFDVVQSLRRVQRRGADGGDDEE